MGLTNFGSAISGFAGLGSGLAQSLFGRRRHGMHSALNINKLSSEINQYGGLYKPNLFVVNVRPKNPVKFFANAISPTMPSNLANMRGEEKFEYQSMFLCTSVSLPGTQIIASDHRRQGYGTFDRRPYTGVVTDTQLTFFVDNDGYLLNHFDRWTNAIFNKDARAEHGTDTAGKQLFEIGYRDDYLCEIDILCLTGDRTAEGGFLNNACLHYTLREAFPMLIGDVSLAWAETDAYSVLPVQFSFRSYDVKRISIGDRPINPFGANALGLNEVLGIIAGVAGSIGSFRGASKQSILMNGINLLNNRKVLNNTTGIF